jgi:hypothetical protein
MIVVPSYLLYRRVSDRDGFAFGDDWPFVVTPFVGIILLNTVYSTSYQDAIRAAVQFNERAEEAFEYGHPHAPLGNGDDDGDRTVIIGAPDGRLREKNSHLRVG